MPDRPPLDWIPLAVLIGLAALFAGLWLSFPYLYAYVSQIQCIAAGRVDCLPH
jgi:hypothetical protein